MVKMIIVMSKGIACRCNSYSYVGDTSNFSGTYKAVLEVANLIWLRCRIYLKEV